MRKQLPTMVDEKKDALGIRTKRYMRMITILMLMSFASPLLSRGQSVPTVESPAPARVYHLLREDDDWSFLADPAERQGFWDPIKYIRLRRGRNDWFLSMGGEAREVWEQIGNDNWGQQPFMNAYFNERYMLYFDVHYGKHVRWFVELKSGLNSYRIGGPRPIDEKKLDFQTAFLEAGDGGERKCANVGAGGNGRGFGSGRLIDVGEGPQVRLSFDGFKVKTGIGPWQIDGFAVRPDLDKPGFFDNAPNHAVGLWGVYAVRPLTRNITLDTYYLGLDRKTAAFDRGLGHEVRHSIGARLSRPVAQTKPGWDFDYEAVWQFGTFGSANVRAWTMASETGYTLPTILLKTRFSAKADISSGDDPRTNTLRTFNPLFPKGNYFGVLATAGPGPINFIDVHPRAEATLPHGMTVSVDWIFQWRGRFRDREDFFTRFLIIRPGARKYAVFRDRPSPDVALTLQLG